MDDGGRDDGYISAIGTGDPARIASSSSEAPGGTTPPRSKAPTAPEVGGRDGVYSDIGVGGRKLVREQPRTRSSSAAVASRSCSRTAMAARSACRRFRAATCDVIGDVAARSGLRTPTAAGKQPSGVKEENCAAAGLLSASIVLLGVGSTRRRMISDRGSGADGGRRRTSSLRSSWATSSARTPPRSGDTARRVARSKRGLVQVPPNDIFCRRPRTQ
mmetsp:Transcript_25857/g.79823  ORF Transcript_25857/g.79823 Transcript_25857/m.79823 type:complete len:217 (-) Transcript_25857:15-665(-)